MSMYGLLHGENSDADLLLAALSLKREDCGRFRDIWVTAEGEIALYTRLGGGNRECWCDGEPHYCCGKYIDRLQAHPRYLRDADDDFDCTYATFYFSPPDSIPDDYPRGESGDERWARTLSLLKEVQS